MGENRLLITGKHIASKIIPKIFDEGLNLSFSSLEMGVLERFSKMAARYVKKY